MATLVVAHVERSALNNLRNVTDSTPYQEAVSHSLDTTNILHDSVNHKLQVEFSYYQPQPSDLKALYHLMLFPVLTSNAEVILHIDQQGIIGHPDQGTCTFLPPDFLHLACQPLERSALYTCKNHLHHHSDTCCSTLLQMDSNAALQSCPIQPYESTPNLVHFYYQNYNFLLITSVLTPQTLELVCPNTERSQHRTVAETSVISTRCMLRHQHVTLSNYNDSISTSAFTPLRELFPAVFRTIRALRFNADNHKVLQVDPDEHNAAGEHDDSAELAIDPNDIFPDIAPHNRTHSTIWYHIWTSSAFKWSIGVGSAVLLISILTIPTVYLLKLKRKRSRRQLTRDSPYVQSTRYNTYPMHALAANTQPPKPAIKAYRKQQKKLKKSKLYVEAHTAHHSAAPFLQNDAPRAPPPIEFI